MTKRLIKTLGLWIEGQQEVAELYRKDYHSEHRIEAKIREQAFKEVLDFVKRLDYKEQR